MLNLFLEYLPKVSTEFLQRKSTKVQSEVFDRNSLIIFSIKSAKNPPPNRVDSLGISPAFHLSNNAVYKMSRQSGRSDQHSWKNGDRRRNER